MSGSLTTVRRMFLYLRSAILQTRYMEPFLTVIKAFLEKRMVSALMVGLVNLANTIPAMQAWNEIKDENCVKPLRK